MQDGLNQPLWASSAATAPLARPRVEGEVAADVCVIGLGGSGLTALEELAAAGLDAVGIDAGAIASGAAGRNGGLLLAGARDFYHVARRELGRERALALYRATEAERARIARATPSAVRATGSLRIATSDDERDDCEEQLAAMREDGLEVERATTPFGDGLRFPADLAFDPLERCRGLAADLVRRGVRLYEHSRAVDIAPDRVTTEHGTVRAARVVVAVDGNLERVLPELEGRVRTARLQMLGTAPAHDVVIDTPMYLRYGYEYVQQLPDGRLALGGFRDRYEAAEWTSEALPTPALQADLEHFLRSTLRTEAEVTHRWAASVAYSAGPLPVLAEVRGGVIALGAYSGTGNLIGALCGRAAATLVRGVPDELVDLFMGS